MSVVGNKELLQSAYDATGNKKVYQHISLLVDRGFFQELDAYVKSADRSVGVVTGFGYVDGLPVYVFAQDSEIDGGAMSKTQAYETHKLYGLALKTGTPVVRIYGSVGRHLKKGAELPATCEGILLKSNNLSSVVPQVFVMFGPCISASALTAAGADFVIIAEDATFTIETAGENGSAKAASKLGLAHWVGKTGEDALDRARKAFCRLLSNNLSLVPEADTLSVCSNSELQEGAKATGIISAAADDGSYMEFCPEYDTSAITDLALVNGASVDVIGYQDIVGSYCCSKAVRFVRFCGAFSLPIVAIVDADKFASLHEVAKLLAAYSEAATIKITVIFDQVVDAFCIATTGRGVNADVTMAWTSTVVSPISPAATALLQSSDQLAGSENPIEQRKQLIEDCETTRASSFAAATDGYVEDIIPPEETRQKLVSHLEMLADKRVSTLPKKRSNILM